MVYPDLTVKEGVTDPRSGKCSFVRVMNTIIITDIIPRHMDDELIFIILHLESEVNVSYNCVNHAGI